MSVVSLSRGVCLSTLQHGEIASFGQTTSECKAFSNIEE